MNEIGPQNLDLILAPLAGTRPVGGLEQDNVVRSCPYGWFREGDGTDHCHARRFACSCASLNSINLGSNRIDGEGAQQLCTALKENSRREVWLEVLMLQQPLCWKPWAMGKLGMTLVLTALLMSRSIGDTGAASLAAVLERCLGLIGLGLGHNSITDQGAKQLASSLPANLESLQLTCNAIGDEGALEFKSAVEKGLVLDLMYNNLSSEVAESLRKEG
ncbi:unnamed protein product [Effrenium voratum]|nr:unnamed protein product [Effrenium voratum]